MSTSAKALFAMVLFTVVAACAQQEEVVVVEPTPIVAEPTSNKF
jgi:hypothetical protein